LAAVDTSTDISADMSVDREEGRWLTYPELAKARGGIDEPSAIRLATRRGWRRRKNNRGQMQVLVPIEELKSRDRSPDISADASADTSADISNALNALGDAVAVLREQLEVANGRADREEQDRARAECVFR
jgi:hypothetical protein